MKWFALWVYAPMATIPRSAAAAESITAKVARVVLATGSVRNRKSAKARSSIAAAVKQY
jgi:hypothetical protein